MDKIKKNAIKYTAWHKNDYIGPSILQGWNTKMGYKNDSMVISIAPQSSINIKIRPLARQLGQI